MQSPERVNKQKLVQVVGSKTQRDLPFVSDKICWTGLVLFTVDGDVVARMTVQR